MASSLLFASPDLPGQIIDLLWAEHGLEQTIFVRIEAFQPNSTDCQVKGKDGPFTRTHFTLKQVVFANDKNIGADVGLTRPLDQVIVSFLNLLRRRGRHYRDEIAEPQHQLRIYGATRIGKFCFIEQPAQLSQELRTIILIVDPYLFPGGELVGYGKCPRIL